MMHGRCKRLVLQLNIMHVGGAVSNQEVGDINSAVMRELFRPGMAHAVATSQNYRLKPRQHQPRPQDLCPEDTSNVSGLPPHELVLKEGMPVVLLQNSQFNIRPAFFNGTTAIVKQWLKQGGPDSPISSVICTITNGMNVGKEIYVERVEMKASQPAPDPSAELRPIRMRYHFPIQPMFAMTIRRCQGQTLSMGGIYLEEAVKGHGDLYVALSRFSGSFRVVAPCYVHPDDPACTYTPNIVIKELLLDG